MRRLLIAMIWVPFFQIAAADLHVFAAASLTDAMREIAVNFENQTGTHVSLNLGASSLLERQIEAGALADVFFSADDAKMEELARKGLIDSATRKDLLGNSLVIVIAANVRPTIKVPGDLLRPEVRRIAVADPQAVPAGIYARTFLERVSLFEKLRSRLVPTENVRAALAAVEAGSVDAAFVYKTDAAISKRVQVALAVPGDDVPAITYPVAVLRGTKHPAHAAEFVHYLQSKSAGAVFTSFGFVVKS